MVAAGCFVGVGGANTKRRREEGAAVESNGTVFGSAGRFYSVFNRRLVKTEREREMRWWARWAGVAFAHCFFTRLCIPVSFLLVVLASTSPATQRASFARRARPRTCVLCATAKQRLFKAKHSCRFQQTKTLYYYASLAVRRHSSSLCWTARWPCPADRFTEGLLV
jgi:hypothetical protein